MQKLLQNTIIFDLDGTLIASADSVITSMQYMQTKMNMKPWAYDDLLFTIGPPLMDTFRDTFQFNEEDAKTALAFYREKYFSYEVTPALLFDGVPELLADLKAKGKRLAVATSKYEPSAVELLTKLQLVDYFDVIGGDRADLGRNTKTKVLAHVVETLGGNKEDMIMVGDRKYDIIGSKNVGIPCIAVGYGYGNLEEFQEYHADYIIPSTKALSDSF